MLGGSIFLFSECFKQTVFLFALDSTKCLVEQAVVCEHILNFVTGISVFKQHLNICGINSETSTIGEQEFFMHVIIRLVVIPAHEM